MLHLGKIFFMVIVRFLETFVGSMSAENFQICQRDGTCTAGCVLQEKEGLLELVEKGKIAARTEKLNKMRVSTAAATEMKIQLLEHINSVTENFSCLFFRTCIILV